MLETSFLTGARKKTPSVRPDVFTDDTVSTELKMAEDIKAKLENYRTAPFDARFPNQNQTRNCWSNYLGKTACQGQRR